MLKKFTHFYETYERPIGTLLIIAGFIFDNLTLARADLLPGNLTFITFLSLAAVCIVLSNIFVESRYRAWILFVFQFFLGALSSMSLVFYSRSSSLEYAWPFLLVLVAYLIANEMLKKHYTELLLQISGFFVMLFSYSIFSLAVVFKEVSLRIFLLSDLMSVVVITILILIVNAVNPTEMKQIRKWLALTIPGIFILINIFYFTNLIPPVPLLLKSSGVYHSVVKNDNGNYTLEGEKKPAFTFFEFYPTLHVISGDPLYVFNSVFAPTKASMDIIQEWQYYDPTSKKWITKDRFDVPIIGGRDNGYRFYSYKTTLAEGKWRVSIMTSQGQIVGITKFNVKYVSSVPTLGTTSE